jgi:cell pole-organizing protein PopZ
MAQASSAQREPSMEEILASIRRIIEDSDTHRGPGEEQPLNAEAEGSASMAEPVATSAAEVDAFRVEPREPTGGKASEAADVTLRMQPVTLAGMDAQSARERYPTPVEPTASAVRTSRVDTLPRIEVGLAGELDIEDDLRADSDRRATETPATDPAPKFYTPAMQPDEPYLQPESRPALAAIMSDRAGRQVSAAFGELSDVFAASRKKSFDEMAEEMMRPMLQDWLDNNLPLLVERLVREEIERVARGVR